MRFSPTSSSELLRDQLFGLRVELRHARLPEIIAIGIVARLLDLALVALGAQLLERLALAAQLFVDLAGA